MGRVLQFALAATMTLAFQADAARAQSRHALVIGNGAYEAAPPLKTPVVDAEIVAETLRAAAFDVTELHDVRAADIGLAMRDFLEKAAASGPDGIAFFYYSGHGARSQHGNYLVPVDAVISTDGDIDNEALRLNEFLEALIAIPQAARIVVLDAARDHRFGSAGSNPVPKGLAINESVPGTLLAFAAAPGALAIDGDADYSLYTGALVTNMRQPGLDIEQVFKETRMQVNQATAGAQTPWSTSGLTVNVTLFAPAEPEPAPPPQAEKPAPKPAAKTGSRTRTVRPPTDADVMPAHPAVPPVILEIPGIGIGRGGFGIGIGR